MKHKFLSLLLALMTLLLFTPDRSWASATVAPPEPAVTSTNASPTTVNQLMIDILTGVKTAGADAYAVSKSTLRQAYGAVEREAPEVLKEFLRWRLLRALMFIALWACVALLMYYWSRRFLKLAEACPPPKREEYSYHVNDHGKSAYTTLRYILLVAMLAPLFGAVPSYLFDAVQIYAAPRVYIIEYVADTITSSQRPPGR